MLKVIRRILLILCTVVVRDVYASTTQSNSPYYLKIGGGVSMPTFHFNKEDYNEGKASGSNFGQVGIGQVFDSHMRGDLVLTLRGKGSVSAFVSKNLNYAKTTHSFRSNTLMYNVYYDLLDTNLSPYFNLGLGISQNILYSYNSKIFAGGIEYNRHSTEKKRYSFAWAIGAGIKKELTPRFYLDLNYNFVSLGKLQNFDIIETSEKSSPETSKTRSPHIKNHEISISLIYKI